MNEEINIPNNSEIDKALKQFEAESQVPSYGAVKYYNETDTPKIVKLTMKYSGVKEQKQAEYILLGFVVVALLVSGFLVFNPLSGGNYPKLDSTILNKLMQTPPAEIPSIKN